MTTMARPYTQSIAQRLRKRIASLRRRFTPIQRYVIRSKHEWAIIHIDERYGSFACQSTFGTYAYIWRSIGDDTLKEFLRDLRFDYFMGKARPGYRKFDFEATCDNVKRLIRQYRREGSIDKKLARKAYREIEFLSPDGEQAFASDMYRSEVLVEVFHSDFMDLIRETPDADSRGFWEVIWPKFVEQIGGRKR
jgi:hypothetical protein